MDKTDFILMINAVAEAMDAETEGVRQGGPDWLAERLAKANGLRHSVLTDVIDFVKRNGLPADED